MNFLTGITNLTSWMGNVIMPTLAALFFALGVLRYAHGQAHTYAPWAGFLCLMVSGVLRGMEKFAAQAAWNNPDLVWITLRGDGELDVQRLFARVRGTATLARSHVVRGHRSSHLCRRCMDAAFQRRRTVPGIVRLAAVGGMVHRTRVGRH